MRQVTSGFPQKILLAVVTAGSLSGIASLPAQASSHRESTVY